LSGNKIYGLGVDLVEVERIGSLVAKWGERFLERVYTEKERRYCLGRSRSAEHLAGRFAAKEAAFKALGRKVSWKAVETVSSSGGAPRLLLHLERASLEGHVSISHTKKLAVAYVLLVGD